MEEAIAHCTRGLGIWPWAGNTDGEPDVVLACAGDVPTLETLAAADLLRTHLPDLKVRVINVVDLMRLEPDTEHPHGLSDRDFDALFTADKPVIFAYHGYPSLIHRLTYRRNNHHNLHVRGYKEEGTTTTPFDMVMLNDLDRFHLVMDVIDRVPSLGSRAAHAAAADGRRPPGRPRLHPRARRGRPGDHRLDLAGTGLTPGSGSEWPRSRGSKIVFAAAWPFRTEELIALLLHRRHFRSRIPLYLGLALRPLSAGPPGEPDGDHHYRDAKDDDHHHQHGQDATGHGGPPRAGLPLPPRHAFQHLTCLGYRPRSRQ